MFSYRVGKLFLVVFGVLLFFSCGDKSDFKPVMSYLSSGYESSSIYDSSLELKFGMYPEEEGYHVLLLRDEQVEKEVFANYKTTVNLGYGEVVNAAYKVAGGIFMKDRIIVLQSYENVPSFYYVNLFDYNLNKIAGVDVRNQDAKRITFSRWGDTAFLVDQYLKNGNTKLDIYNDKADLLSSKEYSMSPVMPDPSNPYIVNGYEEYISYNNQEIFKQNLGETKKQWTINWVELIKNKPEGEVNPPKLDIVKCEIEGVDVIVDMNITYYSGDKETIHIKIDYKFGNATIK